MFTKLNDINQSTDAKMYGVYFNRQKIIYTLIALGTLIMLFWLASGSDSNASISNPKISAIQKGKDVEIVYSLKQEWILENCLREDFSKMSLEYLPEYVAKLEGSNINECKRLGDFFNSMFELEKTFSDVRLTPEFSKRVLGWLDNNQDYLEQAKHQKVIKLYNKFVNDEMIFNPLRGKRPIKQPAISDKKYSYDMINESKATCDFCYNYTKNTADDVFDKIETEFSYTAANTFKYDKWHGLILSRNHNPMELSLNEFVDMFKLGLNWFEKVNTLDNQARFPEMIWDCMPKAGASQVHPHFQLSMGSKSHYGGMRRWLDASERYYTKNLRNMFEDFKLIHKSFGLTYESGDAIIIANLIPIKEQEFILIGKNSKQGFEDLVKLLHQTIKIFVEDLEQFSWSMGAYFPKYEGGEFFTKKSKNENDGDLDRIFFRIVFRTPAAAPRSDYNGLDMYTSSVLGIDRYTIARKLFGKFKEIHKE